MIIFGKFRPGNSHLWAGLMKAKADFVACDTFKVQNENKVLGGCVVRRQTS